MRVILSCDSQEALEDSLNDTDSSIDDVFNSKQESIVQDNFMIKSTCINIRDTSSSALGTPFSPGMANENHLHVTGHSPDAIHPLAPMFIELKAGATSGNDRNNSVDDNVIGQCLERIGMFTQRLSYLDRIVGFGCCKGGAWLVYSTLKIMKHSIVKARHYYVSKIPLRNVSILWNACVNALSNDPCFFTSKHTRTLSCTLKRYYQNTLPLEYYCVKWLASSSAGTVFKVIPPSSPSLGKFSQKEALTISRPKRAANKVVPSYVETTTTVEWNRRSEESITVKVQYGREQIEAELSCFTDMYNACPKTHYAIGFYWNGEFTIFDKYGSIPDIVCRSVKTNVDGWVEGEREGCGLLMHTGRELSSHYAINDFKKKHQASDSSSVKDAYIDWIIKGSTKSLAAIHKAGYVHRDIRLPNILDFGDRGVQLIDYGWAAKIHDTVSFKNNKIPSGILNTFVSHGYAKEDFKEKAKQWDTYLDEKMLQFTLVDLQTKLEKYDDQLNLK